MFFILSKLLTYLIMPVSLLALLLLIALLARNPKIKKVSLALFVFFFFFFTNPFIAKTLMSWWENPATPLSSLAEEHQIAVILSGVTTMDSRLPDRVHLHKGADRIMHAVQLHKSGKVKKIVVSGGSGHLLEKDIPSESEQIKRVLLLSGVPEAEILLEDKSRNTYENATFTKALLQEYNIPDSRPLVITSAFHMRRSIGCFKKAGFDPIPFSTQFFSLETSYSPDATIIPSVEALEIWTTLLKEWVGYSIYRLAGYI